ncbi:hypothetical protein D9M73_126460 [compost metagenome]
MQEHEHDHDDQRDRFHQRFFDFLDRQFDERGRILREAVGIAIGEVFRGALDLALYQLGGAERVRTGSQADGQTGTWVAVDAAGDAVIFRAELDPADIGQPHRRSVGLCLEHDRAELLGGRQA